MMDKSIMVDGLAVLWEEVLESVGSKVCLDGNARHAIAHRSAQANTCVVKWRPDNVAGLSLEFECLDDGKDPKRQNCELECEDGGERHRREEAAMDGIEPAVETVAQKWPSMDRKGQYERVDCHQRMYAQLGWSCCQDGPQRNLCEGLEMPRPPMVEMETTPLERSGERQMVWPTPTAIQNLPVGGHGCWGSVQIHRKCRRFVGICPGQHGLVASCSKPWKLETVFDMWKEPCIDGPECLGDPYASGMTGTDAGAAWFTRRRNVRERFGVHVVHLYLYQANRDIASVSSWY